MPLINLGEPRHMRRNFFLFGLIAALCAMIAACGGTAPANSGNANTAANNNSNDPTATTKPAKEPTTNNAPTLTPVFKAYCDAWVKNDEAALRKVYSSDTLKIFDQQMKEEKTKSLIKFLEDDKVSGTPCEVTNEVITGDSAVANIISNKYPNGIKIVFVKENGEWKITNKSPSLDAAKPTVTSSDTSKTADTAPASSANDKKDAKK